MQELKTVFQHDDFIIIDKPEGISFHNNGNELGLHTILKKQLALDIWPVHRLDKITSGLVIFAKSQIVATQFGKLFDNNKIKKVYIAISDKKPKKKQGFITGDMQKARSGNWKLTQSKVNPAKTQFVSKSLKPGFRFFVLKPITGKTHQLRVALKSISSPILGDHRYTGSKSDRGYLHAFRLSFDWSGEYIEVESSPSSGLHFQSVDFNTLLKDLI